MSKTEDYPIEGQVLEEDRRNRRACIASIYIHTYIHKLY